MLHTQTLTLLAILLQLLLSLIVLWTTAGRGRPAVLCWCLGGVSGGVGLLLIGARPWAAPWLSYHLANTLLLINWLLAAQALRWLLGRPWSKLQLILWSLAAWLFYSAVYSLYEPTGRALAMRGALLALVFYSGWLALEAARRWHSFNAGAIAVVWLMLGLGLLAQVLLYLGGGVQPYPVNNSADAGMLALVMLITVAVAHLAFAGLIAERAVQARARREEAQVLAQESARLQESLQQSERQNRLLLVSGTLAHELNQPLTAALTHIQLAQRLLEKGQIQSPLLPELLDDTANALQRTGQILERTRQAARAQPLPVQPLDLGPLLQQVIDLFRDDWHSQGVQFTQALPDGPLWCRGHPVALTQLLVNLLRNATQAMAACESRQLHLHGHCVADREGSLQTLHLRLRDSGPGVPAEVLARWGDPFVSSRREGLGLGLAISRAIARQHGGHLLLSNPPDGGAEACLQLPLCPPPGPAC